MSDFTDIFPDEPEPYTLIIYLSPQAIPCNSESEATENGGSVFSLDVESCQQYHRES